jgi:hypothetical protein
MPRDGAGNYTLPAGNPVVTGTVITSTWANPTMADLGNEIGNSLSRDGQGGMRAPLEFFDGSSAAPGITFTLEPGAGMFRAGAGIVGIAATGIPIALFDGATGNVSVNGVAPTLDAELTRKDYVDGLTDLIAADVSQNTSDISDNASAIGQNASDIADLETNKVDRAGDTMTGPLAGVTPVDPADLTRKDYVDAAAPTRQLWGGVGSAGNIIDSGSGDWSVGVIDTGQYSIIFDTPFADANAYGTMVTLRVTGLPVDDHSNSDANQARIRTYDVNQTPATRAFSFLVVGNK